MVPDPSEWLVQSEYDLMTARDMYKTGRYIYTVYMCHLAIEKALKALVCISTGKTPPKIHNLIRLLKLALADTIAREYLLKTEDVIKCIAKDPRLKRL